jgi:hypothetical protein
MCIPFCCGGVNDPAPSQQGTQDHTNHGEGGRQQTEPVVRPFTGNEANNGNGAPPAGVAAAPEEANWNMNKRSGDDAKTAVDSPARAAPSPEPRALKRAEKTIQAHVDRDTEDPSSTPAAVGATSPDS